MTLIRKVAAMGLITTLLAACGGGSADVPSGEPGLTTVQDTAVGLVRDVVQQVAQDSGADVGTATGAYRFTGYSGQEAYVEFVADVELSGGTYDADAFSQVLEDAGLKVSAYEDPNGDNVLLGRGDQTSATVRTRPDDGTIRLQVVSSGARLDNPSADRRAQLREESPIDVR